jgi:nitroreductase
MFKHVNKITFEKNSKQMSLLDSLKWRYATKKFDATKQVSDADFAKIQESIQLAATSYGLQMFNVIDVQDPAVREKLVPASWGQTQVADASHVLVFTVPTQYDEAFVDNYIALKAEVSGISPEDLKGYADFMKGTISKQSPEQFTMWNAKQTYIALGNAMAMCGELNIDSCPMEGFDAAQYNEILGLNEKNQTATVVLPIGYRSDEDATQHAPKVRKSIENTFETV